MKRAGYLSLFLLLALVVSALPGFGQQQPNLKTRPEYDGYLAVYNEKDPAKKAALGEKFIAEFKESEGIPNVYTMTIGGYMNSKNWAKTMELADRAVALPNADNKLKEYALQQALTAAQQANDVDKTLAYGDKLLAVNPQNLNAMIIMSSVLPSKAATDKTALDKAEKLASQALAGIQGMAAKASAAEKAQFTQIEGTLYATRGLVAYNRQDYMKSIQEYEQAVQRTPKDDMSHFYLALDYQALTVDASKKYQAAVEAENKAKREKAEQPVIDELTAHRMGLEEEVRKHRDKAIDEFAIATAIGGPLAAQAKDALTKMWTSKNDSTAGLEEFIAEKKKQLE